MSQQERFAAAADRARSGGPERYRDRLPEQGKLPVRERVVLLCDPSSFVEDALLANALADELGADGVVTGKGMFRDELLTRFAYASNKDRFFSDRRHGVPPV